MKIRKIKIENYKIFDNLELDFINKDGKTLDMVVLAGINGTGKTTLLELISSALVQHVNTTTYQEAKYVRFDLELSNDEMEAFEKYIASQKLEDKFNAAFGSGNIISIDNGEGDKNAGIMIFPDTIHYFRQFIRTNDFDFKICYLHDFSTTLDVKKLESFKLLDFENFEHNIEEFFKITITRHLFDNRNNTAAQVINAQIDRINSVLGNIETVSRIVDIDDNKLIFENIKGNKLLLKDLSAGEKQLFYRAIYLSALELANSIVLVDEPELSLHPTWQKSIADLYKKAGMNNQVFMATHSPHIIGATMPENLFALYINDDNHKVEAINIGKSGKHTKGVEPNRILRDIMQTPLRDEKTQEQINYVARNLKNDIDKEEMQTTINQLIEKLGHEDPFIIRLKNQLLLLSRKKQKDEAY